MAIHNQTQKIHHKNDNYQKVVPFILFIFALVLLFKLIKPMIVILLSSILVVYISFPIYKRIIKKIPNKTISVILSLLVILIIVLIPFSFLIFGVTQQGYYLYKSLSTSVEKGALFGFGCDGADSELCALINQFEKLSLEQLSKFGLDDQLYKSIPILEQKVSNLILSIPVIIAQIFLTLVISYFILKDWKNILEKIVNLIPMRTQTVNILIKEFGNISYTVIYAQLFVALVQGVVGGFGFYIFGGPFPILSGVIIAFCALIPAIGTAIIWLPVSLFLILSGYVSHDHWMMGKGIGLFLYGMFIISTIDNILLAKIVHTRAKVSQISVIVGVIGGIGLFGIVGIFIGPIMLPLLMTYFQTFKERFI